MMPTKTPKQRLADMREKVVEIKAAQDALQYAPAAPEERRKAIEEALDQEARRFATERLPTFLLHARCARDVPMNRVLPTPDDPVSSNKTFHGALCYYFGDLLKEKLIAVADACEAGPPLDTVERRSAELARELLELERAEEALIRDQEAEGTEINRRTDADPAVVLAP